MSNKNEKDQISNITKVIVLTLFLILFFIIINLVARLSGNKDEVFYNCDTNYAPDACPEPDYDKDLDEQLNQYPDDSY